MNAERRNTTDSYQCRECAGTGAHEINSRNPFTEDYVACGECCGTGWIRWRAADPLERLKFMRDVTREWKFTTTRHLYDSLRRRAYQRVRLPDRQVRQYRRAA